MTQPIQRHHWIHTIVGQMDATWRLTDHEIYRCINLVDSYLKQLRIPERGEPAVIPAELALELSSQHWSRMLEPHLEAMRDRPIYHITPGERTFPLEIWRADLERQLRIAYPDLSPMENLAFSKWMTELLDALEITQRRPTYLPESTTRVADDA